MNINKEHLAWIAGLLEGEGTFLIVRGYYPKIACAMTDEDVIDKLVELCGGSKDRSEGRKTNWKPTYRWTLSGDKALELMIEIQPYMFSRRSARITEVRVTYENWKQSKIVEAEAYKHLCTKAANDYLQGKGSLREIGRKYKISHVTVKNYVNEVHSGIA